MAKINAINNESDVFTIDPGASGDSWIQFDINTTGEWRIGVDDDDGDAFKLAKGSALGTSDMMVIDASGNITISSQPAFLATGGNEANCTGAGTIHSYGSITALTELFDRGSDFTPGDGAGTGASFVAPITGLYVLGFEGWVNQQTSTGALEYDIDISTSNRNYEIVNLPTRRRVANFYGVNNQHSVCCLIIADMDASDTVTWTIQGSGGSADSNTVQPHGIYGALLG